VVPGSSHGSHVQLTRSQRMSSIPRFGVVYAALVRTHRGHYLDFHDVNRTLVSIDMGFELDVVSFVSLQRIGVCHVPRSLILV